MLPGREPFQHAATGGSIHGFSHDITIQHDRSIRAENAVIGAVAGYPARHRPRLGPRHSADIVLGGLARCAAFVYIDRVDDELDAYLAQ